MLTHNATHNEVIDDIFRNTHAPARKCHISAGACANVLSFYIGND